MSDEAFDIFSKYEIERLDDVSVTVKRPLTFEDHGRLEELGWECVLEGDWIYAGE